MPCRDRRRQRDDPGAQAPVPGPSGLRARHPQQPAERPHHGRGERGRRRAAGRSPGCAAAGRPGRWLRRDPDRRFDDRGRLAPSLRRPRRASRSAWSGPRPSRALCTGSRTALGAFASRRRRQRRRHRSSWSRSAYARRTAGTASSRRRSCWAPSPRRRPSSSCRGRGLRRRRDRPVATRSAVGVAGPRADRGSIVDPTSTTGPAGPRTSMRRTDPSPSPALSLATMRGASSLSWVAQAVEPVATCTTASSNPVTWECWATSGPTMPAQSVKMRWAASCSSQPWSWTTSPSSSDSGLGVLALRRGPAWPGATRRLRPGSPARPCRGTRWRCPGPGPSVVGASARRLSHGAPPRRDPEPVSLQRVGHVVGDGGGDQHLLGVADQPASCWRRPWSSSANTSSRISTGSSSSSRSSSNDASRSASANDHDSPWLA